MSTELLISQAVGFMLGLATSWVFWRFMLLLRPDVRVAAMIAKGHSRKEPDRIVYRLKIANYGRRQAINISIGAAICRLADLPGGKICTVMKRLPFKQSAIPAIGPKTKLGDSWGLSPVYVFVSTPEFDVPALMANNERLLVTLKATDAISGTTVVTRQAYLLADIKEGDFAWGLGFEVKPEQS